MIAFCFILFFLLRFLIGIFGRGYTEVISIGYYGSFHENIAVTNIEIIVHGSHVSPYLRRNILRHNFDSEVPHWKQYFLKMKLQGSDILTIQNYSE